MTLYQITIFGEGSPKQSCEIECADDNDALGKVGSLDYPHETLVWDGDRLVGRFPPRSEFDDDAQFEV